MLLYNVTVTVDLEIHEDWLRWMRRDHIPDVMATGCFVSYRLSKMLDHQHEDAEVYTVQYLVKNRAELVRYAENFAPELQKHTKARFGDRFVVFRSVMEIIDRNDEA